MQLTKNTENQTRLSFIGKEKDIESELGDFGVRKYDNEIGRFTSIDPLWEKYYSWTPYHYCSNNPVMGSDPGGDTLVYEGSENDVKANKYLINNISQTSIGSMIITALEDYPLNIPITNDNNNELNSSENGKTSAKWKTLRTDGKVEVNLSGDVIGLKPSSISIMISFKNINEHGRSFDFVMSEELFHAFQIINDIGRYYNLEKNEKNKPYDEQTLEIEAKENANKITNELTK
jgi:RHS repeat-associated protein